MASIVDVKPSLCCRLPLRNAPRLLVRRRAQDSLSTHTHHARSPAKGSTSKIYLRGSIAPKAMMSTTATALASISSSTSALPALALSPAVLSWAFALATIHAAALVLLVRDAFSLSLSFIHHEIAKKKKVLTLKKTNPKKNKTDGPRPARPAHLGPGLPRRGSPVPSLRPLPRAARHVLVPGHDVRPAPGVPGRGPGRGQVQPAVFPGARGRRRALFEARDGGVGLGALVGDQPLRGTLDLGAQVRQRRRKERRRGFRGPLGAPGGDCGAAGAAGGRGDEGGERASLLLLFEEEKGGRGPGRRSLNPTAKTSAFFFQ